MTRLPSIFAFSLVLSFMAVPAFGEAKLTESQKKAAKKVNKKIASKFTKGGTLAKSSPKPQPLSPFKRPAVNRKIKTADAVAKIDALVSAKLAEKKIKPTRLATDEEFLRRVYLDVTGTIPTLEQAKSFLASRDANKRAKLIDKLLASPGYVSSMYNYWADLLRITARTRGDYAGYYPKWVKESLRTNKPYDQFVYEMITSEGKSRDNGAVGYWLRDNGMILDVASTTTQVFLGTQIGCAQCHDHPFDVWEQKEFYELAAFTSQLNTRDRAMGGKFREINKLMYKKGSGGKAELAVSRDVYQIVRNLVREEGYMVTDAKYKSLKLPKDYKYDNGKPNQVVKPHTIFDQGDGAKGKGPLREQYARWMTSPNNPFFAKVIANRLWAKMIGVGVVDPVDNFGSDTEPSNPALLAYLTNVMKGTNFDMKAYLRVVLNTQAYQRATTREDFSKENFVNQAGVLRRMTAEQVWDTFVTLTITDGDTRVDPRTMYASQMMGMAPASVDISKMSSKQIIAYGTMLAKKRKEARANSRTMYKKLSQKMYAPSMVRASQVRQPASPGHFLRQFGGSARETVGDAHTDASVPQVLALINGVGARTILSNRAVLGGNLEKAKTPIDKVNTLYLTVLSRYPSPTERAIAIKEIQEHGGMGVQNLVWALVNTREFIFVR
jgi:hypothetical protein